MTSEPIADPVETDCCIVGGGPAGAVLALLLARQGIRVTLLEAHHAFDRDFRGDVLQPPALARRGEIGRAERVREVAGRCSRSRAAASSGNAASERDSFP